MRRVADTDWEAEHYVVVSCEKLRADKKNTQTNLANLG